MERENRRGRESRQHDSGLPPMTARHSGLPGLSATPCTRIPGGPSLDTTRCDRSPAPFEVPPRARRYRRHRERPAWPESSATASSGKCAKGYRFATCFDNCGREDRPIAVIDSAGPQRQAGLHQFVASREHSNAGAANDFYLGEAARRQHADLAGPDTRTLAQQSFTPRNVGARKETNWPGETARRTSMAGPAAASIKSVCSIITTASAPRGMTPPVATRGGGSGRDLQVWRIRRRSLRD